MDTKKAPSDLQLNLVGLRDGMMPKPSGLSTVEKGKSQGGSDRSNGDSDDNRWDVGRRSDDGDYLKEQLGLTSVEGLKDIMYSQQRSEDRQMNAANASSEPRAEIIYHNQYDDDEADAQGR